MTLEQMLKGGAGGLLLLLTLVQITPLKLNPWSALAKWLGHAFNGEVLEKVETIEQKLEKHIQTDNDRHADMRRQRILRFNDELIHGVNHTKEHYNEILHDIDEYERYCDEHPEYKNSRAVLAISNIKSVATKLQQVNGFIA